MSRFAGKFWEEKADLKFQVLDSNQNWEFEFSKIKHFPGSFYFSQNYLKACQFSQNGKACLAIAKFENGNFIYYPFILLKVSSKFTDENVYSIESVYGYSGPIALNSNEKDCNTFNRIFSSWCADKNIIAEFLRFHPLIDNYKLFGKYYSTMLNRRTVCINLSSGFESVLNNASAAKLRNFKRAKKYGLKFRITKNGDNFLSLYYQTMKRLNADTFYYFTPEYFETLLTNKNDEVFIGEAVTEKDEVIASALYFKDGQSLHYHLGGSNTEFKSMYPNVFLMFSTAEKACNDGLKYFHLGGGLTNKDNDNLFRFKRGFSPNIKEFYIGKKIHNPTLYKDIVNKWVNLTGKKLVKLLEFHYGE